MKDTQLLLIERMKAFEPIQWELIPDFGLYMDQVITYIERQSKPLLGESERVFTPSMVNNYVKMGLVNRPLDKKYGREQLAQLLMISMLKQSATAEEMKRLLMLHEGETQREVYEAFCAQQSGIFMEMIETLPLPTDMQTALRAAAYRLLLSAAMTPENSMKEKENGEMEAKSHDGRH